jgi:hypothetical protein
MSIGRAQTAGKKNDNQQLKNIRLFPVIVDGERDNLAPLGRHIGCIAMLVRKISDVA